jgi:hypothetical protein
MLIEQSRPLCATDPILEERTISIKKLHVAPQVLIDEAFY